ncbi:MAG: hypothetical protein ACFCU8_13045 [Thermosynechococcaceae cyanobacterium]
MSRPAVVLLLLLLGSCAGKPAYEDQPYTPTGKVQFDSMGPQETRPATAPTAPSPPVQSPAESPAVPTEQQPTPSVTPSSSSEAVPVDAPAQDDKPEKICPKTVVLTLKTPSYHVSICDQDGNLTYHGTYLPSGAKTELSTQLSDSGYYVKQGSYEYWITKGSIAVYEGKQLVLEEFKQ